MNLRYLILVYIGLASWFIYVTFGTFIPAKYMNGFAVTMGMFGLYYLYATKTKKKQMAKKP